MKIETALKIWIAVTGLFTAVCFSLLLLSYVLDDGQPPQVEQLQAEVQTLRAEVEDVKRVQGSEIYDQIRKERERRATP